MSSQKLSKSFSGLSFLLPAAIAPLTPPIDVPAIMSNLIFFLANALIAPHAKAPREPPPCSTSTFSTPIPCLWLIIRVTLFYK